MTPESLISQDWQGVVARLGGAEALATSARETRAFLRGREIKSAVDLLRLILAYCLGEKGLRLTAAWAAAGIPVIEGEIRLADAAHLQPDRMAHVLDQGGDFLVRAGWRNARWLDARGGEIDIIAVLRKARDRGLIDQPIWLGRKAGAPLGVRLVAVKKSPQAAAEARRKARRNAQREGYQLSKQALIAADWVILVTSLKSEEFTTEDILALYRLRWRIELAFKRLKSLVGLKGPPGFDERSAKPYLLAHLLVILLLEPLIDEFEDSPRLAQAA